MRHAPCAMRVAWRVIDQRIMYVCFLLPCYCRTSFHVSPTALETLLQLEPAQRLLQKAADAAGFGKFGQDFKIDSADCLRQTHSSWFERHIDTHAKGT